jgi:hypothetical protein
MPSSSARFDGERDFERRNYGQSVLRDILSLASSVVGSGKHLGAEKIFALAEATRVFGDDLHELPHLQAYAQAAAEGLDDVGEYVDEVEIAELFDDVTEFAKRQPVITAAFALAVGIAVTQIARNWRTIKPQGSRRPRTRRRQGRRGNGRRIH